MGKPGNLTASKAEYTALLALSSAALRDLQDKERKAAEDAQSAAAEWYSLLDYAVGRRKSYTMHSEEGARAFREGEEATDEDAKRRWYARAVGEYRNARATAQGDEKDRSSLGQTAETAGKAAKEVVQTVGSGLENIVMTAIVAYFVSEAIKGVARG